MTTSPGDPASVGAIHGDPEANRFNPAGPWSTGQHRRLLLGDHWQRHGFAYWAVASRAIPEDVLDFGGVIFKPFLDGTYLDLYFQFTPSAKKTCCNNCEAKTTGAVADKALAPLVTCVTPTRLNFVIVPALTPNGLINRPDNPPEERMLALLLTATFFTTWLLLDVWVSTGPQKMPPAVLMPTTDISLVEKDPAIQPPNPVPRTHTPT